MHYPVPLPTETTVCYKPLKIAQNELYEYKPGINRYK